MKIFSKSVSALMILMLSSAIIIGQSDPTHIQKLKDARNNLAFDIAEGVVPGIKTSSTTKDFSTSNADKGILYDNGPLITLPGGGSGGTDYSQLQDQTLGMTKFGFGCQASVGNSVADDFVVVGTWIFETITFYAYQTGSDPLSTITDVRFQVYDDDPSAGGTVVYGDLTTNVMVSTEWTNIWRVSESDIEENRPIMTIVADATGLVLDAGTYWVEWTVSGSESSGPWCPPVSIIDETNTGNAKQFTTTGWEDLMDVGPQGVPFIIEGFDSELLDNNLGLSRIITPNSGTGLTNMEPVTVKVFNAGNNTQTSFDVSYTVDGGNTITESISTTINSLETYYYTFTTTADLSIFTTYNFEACVLLSGDEDSANDCKTKDVENIEPAYCETSYSDQVDDFISNVLFNTINNTSVAEAGGYGDYTAISTTVDPGSSYDISVEITVDGVWVQNAWVWIDWNQNLDFTDDGEAYDLGETEGTGILTTSIAVPADAVPGPTRMRVSEQWNADPEPCTIGMHGEAEDYTVNVALSTGISQSIESNEMTISYADNNQFIVSYTSTTTTEPLNISVYNLMGHTLIYNRVASVNGEYQYDFDMSYAAPGVYLVRLGNNSFSKVKRIVVK